MFWPLYLLLPTMFVLYFCLIFYLVCSSSTYVHFFLSKCPSIFYYVLPQPFPYPFTYIQPLHKLNLKCHLTLGTFVYFLTAACLPIHSFRISMYKNDFIHKKLGSSSGRSSSGPSQIDGQVVNHFLPPS